MPVTIIFNRVSEKKPKHNEEIIWLKDVNIFDSHGFEPIRSIVEYVWEQVDEYGCLVGNGICYNGESEETMEGFKLEIECNGWYLEDKHLWINADDYWKSLEKQSDD